jgi:hypothetical protein
MEVIKCVTAFVMDAPKIPIGPSMDIQTTGKRNTARDRIRVGKGDRHREEIPAVRPVRRMDPQSPKKAVKRRNPMMVSGQYP